MQINLSILVMADGSYLLREAFINKYLLEEMMKTVL